MAPDVVHDSTQEYHFLNLNPDSVARIRISVNMNVRRVRDETVDTYCQKEACQSQAGSVGC